jgi:pimeloyl-ACP methyl ester carboxylesterase
VPEQSCRIGDVDICFETFGVTGQPPVLLVMGLATQMVAWHEDLCRDLAGRGFHVIRFDNRDVGRSSRMSGSPPNPLQLLLRDKTAARYTLEDMAEDAAGLLDHLGLDSAHVVGASMGAMIAQVLAARRPERVRSLVSIMSSTGSRKVGRTAVTLYPIFLKRPPGNREGYIRHAASVYATIGSPDRDPDDPDVRHIAGLSYDRGLNPAGAGRQLAAIFAAGDRTEQIRKIRAPTLVIHGTEDRLVDPSGGEATAEAIEGARLELIEGMGHDLPRAKWPRLLSLIERHLRAAEEADDARDAA